MANELILMDIETALETENNLQPGSYEVRFYLINPLTPKQVDEVKTSLIASGNDIKKVYQGKENNMNFLGVKFVKHAPQPGIGQWQIIIPLVAVAGLIGIGIFKIQEITNAVVEVALIVGGIAILFTLVNKKAIENASAPFGHALGQAAGKAGTKAIAAGLF
jgi:hypothetical protein